MPETFLFFLLTLTTYRVWRLAGRDDWPPSRWLREQMRSRAMPKRTPYPEEGGELETRSDWWFYLYDMWTCPWCLGSLLSVLVVYLTDRYAVSLPHWVLWAGAVACAVGLLGEAADRWK